MIVLEFLQEALRNLARHKLRSFLTALGIVFGVASVLAMVATGEGARRAILAQIEQLGITNVIVNARRPPESENTSEASTDYVLRYGLTFRDHEQIQTTLPMIQQALPVHDVEEWIWFKSRRIPTKVRGVTPEYFEVLNLNPRIGRALRPLDGNQRSRVCVIHARLLDQAKYLGDPLKLDLKIGTEYFRVVGVLDDSEFQTPNKMALGMEQGTLEVYVPYETVLDRYGLTLYKQRAGSREATRVELHQILCSVRTSDEVLPAARCIATLLDRLHEQTKDYEITVPLEQLETAQRAQKVFNIVLPIIAGISLLVGGIGILNIMLASITERTREIGIRRAIGATGTDITLQFLVETVTLASVGGLLGVALGVVFIQALEHWTDWKAVITANAVLLALAISSLTGITFGLYPARRAASMNPIEALRHD